MLKYIAASGIVLSFLFVFSEIGINVFVNMVKTEKETGVPIKFQVTNAIKKDKHKIK